MLSQSQRHDVSAAEAERSHPEIRDDLPCPLSRPDAAVRSPMGWLPGRPSRLPYPLTKVSFPSYH
jgi:hypothetical protein